MGEMKHPIPRLIMIFNNNLRKISGCTHPLFDGRKCTLNLNTIPALTIFLILTLTLNLNLKFKIGGMWADILTSFFYLLKQLIGIYLLNCNKVLFIFVTSHKA